MSIFQSIKNFIRSFVKPIPLVPVVPGAKQLPEYEPVILRRDHAFTRKENGNFLRHVRKEYAQSEELQGQGLSRQEKRKISRQMVRFAPESAALRNPIYRGKDTTIKVGVA